MNLITDPILTLSNGKTISLPALFAALVTGEVPGFRALRPHQRPAWHMFLVQLGALAVCNAQCDELPDDVAAWVAALRGLTPDHPNDEPWRLVVEESDKPAFMQPPDPGNLKWSSVATPDALDLLITSRNHDLKKALAKQATLEDWVFALVSLQTCEGYGGAGNHGIARMNGGSSSRPMLALAPGKVGDLSVRPSAWWKRDTRRLIAARMTGDAKGIGIVGGPALLWCLDWQEGKQLDLRRLDPWFIEVCRRVRLTGAQGAVCARRATSKAARTDAKAFKGHLGDPWAPVHLAEGKTLTLSGGDFHYARLCELLFSGEWAVPLLARAETGENGDRLLVAEALSRGNSKTEGFKSRVVSLPGNVVPLLSSDSAATLSKAQMEEIKAFDTALRNALALAAAGGDGDDIGKKHYAHTERARKQFDRAADRLFFSSLWDRLEAERKSADAAFRTKRAFLQDLKKMADHVLDVSLPGMPCAAIYRPRAEARARRAFMTTLRRNDSCSELFISEETDAAG